MRRLELSGQKFGRLLVVGFYDIHKGYSRWICLCDCGKKVIRARGHLRTGNTKSCGCLNKETLSNIAKNNHLRPYEARYRSLRRHAELRGLSCDITYEEYLSFANKPCFYCGDRIEMPGIGRPDQRYSLDRVNNYFGYQLDNLVSCCWKCNQAKHDMSQQDFIDMCRKVVDHANGVRS